MRPWKSLLLLCAVVAGALLPSLTSAAPSGKQVVQLLQSRGPLANAFYACLLNGLAQGLPLQQIEEDCEPKLTYDGQGGLGRPQPGGGIGSPGRSDSQYDPASISAKCSAGDPGRSKGSGGSTLKEARSWWSGHGAQCLNATPSAARASATATARISTGK